MLAYIDDTSDPRERLIQRTGHLSWSWEKELLVEHWADGPGNWQLGTRRGSLRAPPPPGV